jgi:hypothetical protein
MILGIQLVSTGLLGEMLRYFTFRPEQEYTVKSILWHEFDPAMGPECKIESALGLPMRAGTVDPDKAQTFSG